MFHAHFKYRSKRVRNRFDVVDTVSILIKVPLSD
jgi:hypothetical protein